MWSPNYEASVVPWRIVAGMGWSRYGDGPTQGILEDELTGLQVDGVPGVRERNQVKRRFLA